MSQFARFGNRKEQELAREFTALNGHPPTDPQDPNYLEFKRNKSAPSAKPVNRGMKNSKRTPVCA